MTKRKKELKKLLIVSDTLFTRIDGSIKFLCEIIPRINHIFDIHIIAPEKREGFNSKLASKLEDIRVISFPIKKKVQDVFIANPKLKEIKKEVCGADIVWLHSLGPLGLTAAHYSKFFNVPSCYYNHMIEWEVTRLFSGFPGRRISEIITKKLIKYYLNGFNLLMIPSEDTNTKLREIGIKTKVYEIKLGVDVNIFKNKRKSRKKNGITIGYVGRIAKEKNLEILKKAFDMIKKKNKNTFLLIVGDGPKEEVEKIKGEGVEITGFVDNIENYLNKMDIFVLPSLTETTSLATIEAMACELPIIISKVGHIKHYVRDRVNGIFFDNQNITDLVDKINELIGDTKLRIRLGKEARKTVINMNSWDEVGKKVVNSLKSI